jgi:phospho-N-acetylmuramoyl-pentapeptide-transferase
MEIHIIKILFLSTLSFLAAFFLTPILTHFLYKYKLGKRIRNNGETPVFSQLHAHKDGTPTMGGVLVWGTVLIMMLGLALLSDLFSGGPWSQLNFLSRQETLLPLGVLVVSALIGLFDDWLDVRGRGVLGGGGLKVWHRLIIYTLIAIAGACWFYFKLDWSVFHIPFFGNFEIGPWYIPVFVFIIVATSFSVNESDGLDGLAGGTLLIAFFSLRYYCFCFRAL